MISHFEVLNAKSSSLIGLSLENTFLEAAAKPLSIFIAHPSHFLTDNKPSGDGLVAFDLISQLAKRGHELHIAVAEMDLRDALPANVKLYPVQTRLKPDSMPWRLEYARAVRKLFETISAKTRIDLIHQLNPVVTGLSLFLGGTGRPLVLGPYVPYWSQSSESPNGANESLKRKMSNAFRERILTKISHRQQKLADALLVTTPAALVRMADLPEIAAKTHILPYSIDIDCFSPATNSDGARANLNDAPSILFLANLRYQKGIYTLIEAFEIVARQHPTCRLNIVGSGSEDAEVRRRAKLADANARISVAGNIERGQVAQTLRSCTVYCLPSYGEPFGMTALEAMACGKPVVATDVGGLSYLITDEGGRKVPPNNPEALAAALLEIVRSPKLQAEMSLYNRRKAVEDYAPAQVIRRLESIYDQVLRSKTNRSTVADF